MEFALATFVAVLAIVLGGYWAFVVRLEDQEKRTLRKRLRVARTTGLTRPDLLKEEQPLSRVRTIDRVLKQTSGFSSRLQQQIEISGTEATVGVFVLGSLFLAAVVFALVFFWTRFLAVSLLLGALSSLLPFLLLRIKAKRRVAMFEE